MAPTFATVAEVPDGEFIILHPIETLGPHRALQAEDDVVVVTRSDYEAITRDAKLGVRARHAREWFPEVATILPRVVDSAT